MAQDQFEESAIALGIDLLGGCGVASAIVAAYSLYQQFGNGVDMYKFTRLTKREQAKYMLDLGCDEAQGYLFAKPMPYDELIEFLAKHDSEAPTSD